MTNSQKWGIGVLTIIKRFLQLNFTMEKQEKRLISYHETLISSAIAICATDFADENDYFV